MSIHMGTTKISPEKTLMEIQKLLAAAGAGKVITDYEKGEPTGLIFSLWHEDRELPYKLPVKTNWVFKHLQSLRSHPWKGKEQDLAQSKRTAWRLILRWLQAQFALMEVGMVDAKEVFLPYYYDGEQTFYEFFLESEGIKLLEEPK